MESCMRLNAIYIYMYICNNKVNHESERLEITVSREGIVT